MMWGMGVVVVLALITLVLATAEVRVRSLEAPTTRGAPCDPVRRSLGFLTFTQARHDPDL